MQIGIVTGDLEYELLLAAPIVAGQDHPRGVHLFYRFPIKLGLSDGHVITTHIHRRLGTVRSREYTNGVEYAVVTMQAGSPGPPHAAVRSPDYNAAVCLLLQRAAVWLRADAGHRNIRGGRHTTLPLPLTDYAICPVFDSEGVRRPRSTH